MDDEVSSHQVLVSRLVSAGAGREDAEDCAQEALLATWLAQAQGNDLANPAGWATTVARRRYIDLVRQQRRQPVLPRLEQPPEPEPSVPPPSARVYAKPPIAPPIKRLSRPELGLQPQRVRHDVSDVLDIVGDTVIELAAAPES